MRIAEAIKPGREVFSPAYTMPGKGGPAFPRLRRGLLRAVPAAQEGRPALFAQSCITGKKHARKPLKRCFPALLQLAGVFPCFKRPPALISSPAGP